MIRAAIGTMLLGLAVCGASGERLFAEDAPATGPVKINTVTVTIDKVETTKPAPPKTRPVAIKQTYQGRSFEEWLTEFRTELDPELRLKTIRPLVLFGVNGHAEEVVPELLTLIEGYGPMWVSLFAGSPDSINLTELLQDGELTSDSRMFGLLDRPDLELMLSARAGLFRVSHRAIDQLLTISCDPDASFEKRVVALSVLRGMPNHKLGARLPEILLRKDLVAEIAWEVWTKNELLWGPEQYATCLKQLCAADDPKLVVRAVQSLGGNPHRGQREISEPILKELANSTASKNQPEIQSAIQQTLQSWEKYSPHGTAKYLPSPAGGEPVLPVKAESPAGIAPSAQPKPAPAVPPTNPPVLPNPVP